MRRLIILGFLGLAMLIGGYGLFLWFVMNVMRGEVALGLGFVAVIAGIASFFNPCAFPLLPVFLAQRLEVLGSKRRLLSASLAAALGMSTFNLLLGSFIGLLGTGFGTSFKLSGDQPNVAVRWLRGIVGFVLIYLGVSHITHKGNPLRWLNRYFHRAPKIRADGSFATFYMYGFGYPLLGIGCGGPILAGLSVYALAQGGFGAALVAFATYAGVMAALMVVTTLLVVFSRTALLDSLRHSTVTIQRVSGTLLILVGIFLASSSVFVSAFTDFFLP